MGVSYDPNSLSMANPATITYFVIINSTTYTSGELAFDQGTLAEDPPYGLWDILNDARAGGVAQVFVTPTLGSMLLTLKTCITGRTWPLCRTLHIATPWHGACGSRTYEEKIQEIA
jgi:hypothetical protein